jgi:hypothetical protein
MKNRIISLLICGILAVQGPAYAGISLKDLNLPEDLFPMSSEYHKVQGVREDPGARGFLIFSVTGLLGPTEVEGLSDLQKWIRETMVIGNLNKNQGAGEGVAEGAAESIKGTGRGLKNLFFHPVNSAKGIGAATGKLGDRIGDAFRDKDPGEKGDGFLSSTKRDIAKKLGVDVYSRNPLLQEKLSSMAKQQMGGRGIVAVATFFIPVGLLASAVVTVSNVNSAADGLVNDKDRVDLYEINKNALLALGFPLAKVKALLNHPYYTPREVTYIRFYLERLRSLRGSEALLDEAVRRTEDIPAEKFLHEMQMAADAIGNMNDAQAIRIVPEGMVLERRGSAALIMGYDLVDASPLGDRAARRALEEKNRLGKRSAEIWNAGVVSSKFGGAMVFKGIDVRRMCLFGVSAAPKDPST